MRAIQTLLFLATFPAMAVGHDLPRTPAATPPHPAAGYTPTGFEENKGQVRTTSDEAAPFVRYRSTQGNTQIFLLDAGIAYQFSRVHYPQGHAEGLADAGLGGKQRDASHDQVRLETYRMDMHLEGADPAARITTEGRSADYTQYYNHEALDVHTYTKVIYHEVYPGIDWVVYTTEEGFKYDFVIRPGADPDAIRLRFSHHEELSVDDEGKLVHGNRMGRFTEARPVSFQDGKEITSRFVLEGDLLRFKVGHYDRTRTLTIDPARVWGTYYGGSGEDLGWTCATDASGNVYVSGFSNSTNAIAQAGHQNTNAGGVDAFLVKFDANGTRQWGTYYGGSDTDMAHHCAVDNAGNVYLAGATASLSNIASGGHQNTHGAGGNDAFLVKFDAGGTRIWGTYYGGGAGERGFYCATDNSGNVYLCGETASATQIASNGHQNTYSNGNEAFLVKFNASGTRLWGTYYGGSGGESGEACIVDGSGNVYLAGFTTSTSGIASGGFQNTLGGSTDAFLAKFNANGTRQWGTYYGSTDADNGWSCAVDGSGNLYLAGNTASSSGIASGGHQNTYGGAPGDGFLVKFNSAGNRQWATYYGGAGDERAYSCAVDNNGDVFIGGHTSSQSGIASDGFQNTYGGGASDAFLAKFNAAGVRTWATYYGGAGHEGGNHTGIYGYSGVRCAVDADGNALLTGSTTSSADIASGGHQNTFGGTRDAFLVKFAGDPGIATGSIVGTVCVGSPVSVPFSANGYFDVANTFTAQLSNAAGSFANPVDIGSVDGTTSGTIDATIPPGTALGTGYRIRVVASNPNTIGTDNGADIVVTEPGASCDDGDPDTNGDVITADCVCAGEPECSTVGTLQESEPNNAHSSANAVSYATTVSGTIGTCMPTDNSVDRFRIITTSQGVLRVDACLSTTGPVPVDVTFEVSISTGSVLGTFTLPAGANDAAITSFFEFPCMGIGTYYIAVQASGLAGCLQYAFSYSTIAPVFGNDPVPNPGVAHDTYQDGQNGFHNEASTYDLFNIVPPFDGRMTIEVQAERAGPAGTMQVRLYNTAGIVMQEWTVPTGANGVPATSFLSYGCLGPATDYDVRFYALDCGTSYRWKYTMAPPVFAADAEGPMIAVAYDTYQEGHVGFVNDNSDTYSTAPSVDGLMHFEIQAEHAGDAPGSMEFRFQYSGVWIVQENVPVGANGQPITTVIDVPCRGASVHTVVFEDPVACGVSYRWRYYTTAPVFANDVEPNNSTPNAIVLAPSAYATGHLEFHAGVDGGGDNTDFIRIDLPVDGVLHVNFEAEHVDASTTETVEAVLMLSTGATQATWLVPVGGSSVPAASTFSLPCRGTTIPYYLRLVSNTCGVSYRVNWSVTPAYYAADPEPNNSYSAGIPMDLSSNWYDGHIGFHNATDDDHYRFTHAGGDFAVTVSAEHAGPEEGTVLLTVMQSSGATLGTFTAPVGASSTPLTSTFTVANLPASAFYTLYLSDVTCGVSYRLHCATDTDGDGVCDGADLCPGGPEPGTPCDDGNPQTVDDVITDACDCQGDFTTGLADAEPASELRLWPNPTTDALWLQVDHARGAAVTVMVRDLTGRLVITQASLQANAQGQLLVDLSPLTPGTYVIELQANGQRWSRRVVKA